MLMGIDQSFTGCGVVVLDKDGKLIESALYVTDKKLSVFERSWDLFCQLFQLAVKHQITHIAIEGLAFAMKGNATRSLAILQGVLVTNLQYLKEFQGNANPIISVELVSPLSLKKQTTGNGKSNKEEMIKATPEEILIDWKKQFPAKQINNLADAYHLAKTLVK